MSHSADQPTDNCPTHQTLVAYQFGRLSDDDARRLATHIDTCPKCVSTLRELRGSPLDSFEAALRRVSSDASEPSAISHPISIKMEFPGALDDTRLPGENRTASTNLEFSDVVRIGPYIVHEVLGRGGMGIVYRAYHERLKRAVALKTLHPAASSRPDSLARFTVEGEAIARFDHPNIVRVYDSGSSGGQHYLVMELVEGETLNQKICSDVMSCDDAAKLVRTLARAVAYAHDHGVIHRDLKPSNVLLARDGTPKIVDFGLARLSDDSIHITASDAVMGTPTHMAPEQAAGRVADINERTDVYALGVILYQALTGAPPFVADTKLRLLKLVENGDIEPPSRSRSDVPPALEAICLRCLETIQNDRYSNCHELAQELDNFLERKPVRARRPSRAKRLRRAMRRRVRPVLGVLLLAGVVAGVTVAVMPRNVSAVPEGESESVRRELERALDKGQPVTLVGETGWPKWFRWRLGKNFQQMQLEPDGTFSAEMIDHHAWGLVELLPDSRTDRFKLTGQLRHEKGSAAGHVGFYVGGHSYPWQPQQDIEMFHWVRFNTVSPIVTIPNPLTGKRPLPEDSCVAVTILTSLRSEWINPPSGPHFEMDMPEHPFGGHMKALGPRNGVWHDFEITVTPDRIEATVAGRQIAVSKQLTPAWLEEGFAYEQERRSKELKKLGKDVTHAYLVPNLRPVYTPRGSVGLVVYPFAAASIRQVVVTPLPAGQ